MRQLTLLFLLLVSVAFSQSAYQRLGYGEIYPTNAAFSASLGSGIVAYQDSGRVSYWNPAALNGLKRVYFGAILGSNFISTDLAVTNTTRFNQVMFAFPVGRNVGMSFQINPVANFASEYLANLPEGTLDESSSGGIWNFSMGIGARVTPTIQLGLKYHKLHGLFRREMNLSSDVLNETYVLKGNIDGSTFELGSLVSLGDKVKLALTADIVLDRPVLDGEDSLGGTTLNQTIEETLDAWPTTIKLGVNFKHSQRTSYLVGISQQIFPADGFSETALFVLPEGWEVVPVGSFQVSMLRSAADLTSRNWLKRIGFQTGFSLKNHYLSKGTENMIFEYAWISGLNLGMRNGKSVFDISAEVGARSGEDSLPAETFARVKFGIEVNDIWFKKIKRK